MKIFNLLFSLLIITFASTSLSAQFTDDPNAPQGGLLSTSQRLALKPTTVAPAVNSANLTIVEGNNMHALYLRTATTATDQNPNIYFHHSQTKRANIRHSGLNGELGFFVSDESLASGAPRKVLAIQRDQKVTIGAVTTPGEYKLYVEDGILTEKVKVALKNTDDWADYVFADDYQLNSIETVEEFVKENKHLPNIPSAEAVVENGINVAEMDAKLLRQIEELWLQMIELNKEVKSLKAENKALKASH